MPEVVIVGVDGSEAGTRAAHFAVDHIGEPDASIVVAYVVPWSAYSIQTAEENERRHVAKEQEARSAQEHIVDPLVAALKERGCDAVEGVVRHGHPAETLCQLAGERGALHVVVGRRGQSKVKSMLFGSTPGNLIQISSVPVTVVP
ncbi:MAG TPA: universal stress protein [Mycobacteriales bacterium]|nr:universal stress protein [Mycobacteriales bacterium]